MKQTLDIYSFRHAVEWVRPDNFSYEGLEVLFNYMTDMETETGEEIELDVIAMCCDYTEDTFAGVCASYSVDTSECEDEDDIREAVLDYLHHNTQVVGEVGLDRVIYFCF